MTPSVRFFGVRPEVVADHHAFALILPTLATIDGPGLALFVDAYAEAAGGVGDLMTDIQAEWMLANVNRDQAGMLRAQERLAGLVGGTNEGVWGAVLDEAETLQSGRFGNSGAVIAAIERTLRTGTNGEFDLEVLTREAVDSMSDIDRLRLMLKLFTEMERLSLSAIADAKQTGRDDVPGLQELGERL